jgi:ABC transport system ATP-binding/permease protein
VILVDAQRVAVRRPDRPLFEDLSVTVSSGERWGVVGINGTGKSTLLRVLAGTAEPEDGLVRRSKGLRVGVLDQRPDLGSGTVEHAVGDSWEAAAVLEHLGMGRLVQAPVGQLSGGQAKRVALARALLAVPGDHEADLLILDEPTNHLDLDGIEWLEERLARQKGGLILVTHDRHMLDRVCSRVLELDRGKAYVHEGGYHAYLQGRDAREERAAVAEATRRNLARRELAWLQRGAPARTAKSKAHIRTATAIVDGRAEAAARTPGLGLGSATARSGEGQGPSAGSVQGSYRNALDTKLAPRLGNKVVELDGVGHRFGDGPWLFRGVEWLLEPGGRYGVVGANGAGKSTLLEVLAGRIAPAEGTVDTGPTVRIGYYDQQGRELDLTQRVREAVAGPTRAVGTPEDKRLMEEFWFDDDAQWAPIGTLSGGERRRLQLLLVLAERPNVLLLDEPTNDLDLDTLRSMEEFLENWPGTMVVVSHDRAFLDRTVEDVLSVEDGKASLVAGGYAGWREQRAAKAVVQSPSRPVTPAPRVDTRESSAASGPAEPKKRSKSTLGFALREAEKEMGRLERKKLSLEAQLVEAGSDHVALTRLGGELSEVAGQLAEAEERWLALAAEAEG